MTESSRWEASDHYLWQ